MENEVLYSLEVLMERYHKVLEINLEDDTFIGIKIDKNERINSNNWKAWALEYCGASVHPDDRARFTEFFNGNGRRLVFYRRKNNENWDWACMELIPTKDTTIAVLLVIDVQDFAMLWEQTRENYKGYYSWIQ